MSTKNVEIVSDPKIMFGKPVIKGTRIPVSLILEKLAEGQSTQSILKDYPNLNEESILACIAYARDAINNEMFLPAV